MSVYVDTLINYGWCLGPSCHMWADTEEELHQMALNVGMKRTWFQVRKANPGCRSFTHYDLVASRRKKAVKLGAIELDRGQAMECWKRLGFFICKTT